MKLAPFLLALLALSPQDVQTLKVNVPEAGSFDLTLPKAWDAKVVQPDPTFPPSIRIFSQNHGDLSVRLAFLPLKEGKLASSDDIKTAARRAAEPAVSSSFEKKIDLVPLESKTGEGYTVTLTDASLAGVDPVPDGKYLKMTVGAFVVNRVLVSISLLSNPKGAGAAQAALEAVGRIQKSTTK